MRSLAATVLTLLGLIAVGACANDAPPTLASPANPRPGSAQQPASDADQQPWREPKSVEPINDKLIIRLSDDLEVYHWIGDDWLPLQTFGPRTLLLVDGWTEEQNNGAIWLHLDLNGDLEGWARLEGSPLSLEQAQALPRLAQPTLPMAQLTVADGTQYTIALLGRSADALSIAVRLGDSDATLLVDRWEIERWEIGNGRYLDSLPIYIGAVAGRWEPWLQQDGDRLEVEAYYFWTSTLAARPNGPQLAWRLPTDMYPVLGRSLDAQWLALRVETLEPPVVWMPIDGQQLDFEPADLPIFLSAGLEVVEIGSDGRASASIFAAEPLVEPEHRREWRNNHELLLHDSNKGTWLWDVERNETRKLSDHWLANISPDGAFAVRHFQIDSTAAANPRAPSHVALVSLDDGDEVAFESVYKPWGTDAPGFQQYWSADSQWLLSTVARYSDEGQRTQFFALSRNGAQVEIIAPEGEWASHWSELRAIEEAGGTLRYLNTDGEESERPWSDEVFGDIALPPFGDLELADGWSPIWYAPRSVNDRLLIAHRTQLSDEFDKHGLAALPWPNRRSWGMYEIGIFSRDGERFELRQVFRGFGLDCAELTVTATWSPDGSRILFGPSWASCA